MFCLIAKGAAKPLYYTGRAGVMWTDPRRDRAFRFNTRQLAEARVAQFNANTQLHGLTFRVSRVS